MFDFNFKKNDGAILSLYSPEPFSRESRQKLKELERLLKQSLADVRAISTADDHRRIALIAESSYEAYKLAHAIHNQIDVYGIRRKQEASRRLPAPKAAAKAPIITTPRQMLLLPGVTTVQGEEVQ